MRPLAVNQLQDVRMESWGGNHNITTTQSPRSAVAVCDGGARFRRYERRSRIVMVVAAIREEKIHTSASDVAHGRK